MAEDCRNADADLARGVARGDAASVATFFRIYQVSVFRYMLCLTADRDDAEDLTQEALLTAQRKIKSYRGESGLKTWVHRVGYHTFTHWKRGRRPSRSLELSEVTARESYGQVEAAEILIRALSQIGPALAQPFVLQELNDLSLEEIANVLQIPVGTVKSRLFTARQRLREIIGDPHA